VNGETDGPVELGVEEVLPESDRLGVLLAVRLSMAAIVMVAASLAENGVDLVVLAVIYAGLATAAELARRRGVVVGEAVPLCMYLLDGAFLAIAVARTGGVGSPVEMLFFLHVVTVVLVSDRQTGIEVAFWDAGLLGGVWLFGSASAADGPAVLSLLIRVATLVLVAVVTSGVIALHQRVLEGQVRHLTDRDPLTGLSNRRGLDQALSQETSRAARTGGALAVALIDLDHFKQVNDSRGHQVGDRVLRQVGEALRDGIREYDVAARLGGDEFVVILPGCGPEEAVRVAERLRASIGTTVRSATGVTATAGVAVFGLHGTEPTELVGAADAALYQGKRAGRNRTTAAAMPHPAQLLEPTPKI
jgi:diguanylate cyclase (GGDEF)-like protein